MTAAGLFDKLKIEAAGLKTPDYGLDLTEQNLHMCSYIMKAQAQYCAHERVKRTAATKYTMLSKLAMQAAAYYGAAYSYATTPPVCSAADPKNFVAILHFNEHTFMAQAYYWAAMNSQKECDETAVGIGKAIAYIRRANEYLDALRKIEKSLSPAVLTQYREFVKHYADKREYLEEQNKKIYHETVPAKVDEIEMLPYGQPISSDTELSKPFDGQEVFARLVPSGVRLLEEEYKAEVTTVMNQTFALAKQIDSMQEQFLSKYGLPGCLHAVTTDQSIPEDLWQKIKQCKEKGSINGLNQVLAGVATMAENNADTLNKLAQQLKQEEDEDQAMRTKYGSAWNRLPSQNLNQATKNQVEYYRQKYQQGKQTDDKVRGDFESKKEKLALIDMDRADLVAKMPKMPTTGVALSPAATKYCSDIVIITANRLTDLLKVLGDNKKEAEGIVESMIKTYEGESVTNEMMQIHQKLKDKRIVGFSRYLDSCLTK